MKTRRGTDYPLPTDSSVESNTICDDDDATISPEIKQQLEGSPSSDFPPLNKPNDGIKHFEIPVDTISPIVALTSPNTNIPVSTSILAGSGLLEILSVLPNKNMNDYWNEIHTPFDLSINNSSTAVLTNQSDY